MRERNNNHTFPYPNIPVTSQALMMYRKQFGASSDSVLIQTKAHPQKNHERNPRSCYKNDLRARALSTRAPSRPSVNNADITTFNQINKMFASDANAPAVPNREAFSPASA